MTSFIVSFTIDIDAPNAIEAAQSAWALLSDAEAMLPVAHVQEIASEFPFDVIAHHTVDLSD